MTAPAPAGDDLRVFLVQLEPADAAYIEQLADTLRTSGDMICQGWVLAYLGHARRIGLEESARAVRSQLNPEGGSNG